MAMVLISSELEEVVEGSDTIVVLRDGAVVGRLLPGEVSQDGVMSLIASAATETEVVAPSAADIAPVATSAESEGPVGDDRVGD